MIPKPKFAIGDIVCCMGFSRVPFGAMRVVAFVFDLHTIEYRYKCRIGEKIVEVNEKSIIPYNVRVLWTRFYKKEIGFKFEIDI